MMTSRKVMEYVVSEPFRPFRIRMASGQAIDIRYPEMIMVGRTSVSVYTATDSDQSEKWHDELLMQLETIEPLDAPVHQTMAAISALNRSERLS